MPSIGGLITQSWRVFRSHFGAIAVVVMAIYVPIALVAENTRLGRVAASVFGIIATLAVIYITSAALHNEHLSSKGALILAFKKYPAALVTSFIAGIRVLGLLLLFILPGIIWLFLYAFQFQVVALRDLSGTEALAYSKVLVKKDRSDVVPHLFTVFGLSVAAWIALSVPLSLVMPESVFRSMVISTVGNIAIAFAIVAATILFLSSESPELILGTRPQREPAARVRASRVVAVICACLFVLFVAVFDWYVVPVGSMKPTILEGDRVLVWESAYQFRFPFWSRIRLFATGEPKRGDVVVIRNPDGGSVPFIKRLVGLPGDVVELRNETLYINGKAQPTEFLPEQKDEDGETILLGTEVLDSRSHAIRVLPDRPAFRTFGPITVPENEVFLLGDNRDESRDARFFGTRPITDLLGRVVGVFWSWNQQFFKGPRWSRIGRPIITDARSATPN